MALATTEARELIRGACIDGVDGVYSLNLPKELIDAVDKTIILIRDTFTKPSIHGNDDFYGLDREIEVQVFYAAHPVIEPEYLDVELYKLFQHHGWQVTENRGHTMDPDTMQLTSTFYVQQTKNL